MSDIERLVQTRAGDRCEYCRMHQSLQGATFHLEHVIPKSKGGGSDNLAWACPECNLRKSDRLTAADPLVGEAVPLFNPRAQDWNEHFRWSRYRVEALTAIGRATIAALDLNHPRRLKIREAEALFQLFPPVDEPSE
jgi:hypothetical protein